MATFWNHKASSLSSSVTPQYKYDVFLSFSGFDTRKNFTGHLLAALEQHGFHTFRDDIKLNRGEDIGFELLKAIEESRISLVVFSKNYAASRWCLDELVKIMECRKTLQHIVLPIFYNVNPSDIRAQKGSLAEVFAKHEECFKECSDGNNKVEKWRAALTEVANLSGWDLQTVANGYEAKFIEKIIEEIANKLNIAYLSVVDHPVGLESRLQDLNMLLSIGSNDVRIVAIWGVGGIGKTTIAKKMYNLIQHKFEGSSFLADVRETSKQPNGLVVLQEQLLSNIFRNGTHNIRNFHQGIEVIKRRALCRKVLLVLDDVDDVQQLKALAISRDSIGSGSRIVITTRDVSSLNFLEVDEIYTPKELDKQESLQLLSWHAFKEGHPIEDYVELSNEVVDYARGLPLALEILGSFLSHKSIPEWKSAIKKLKKIPHDDIQGKLKISFDSLSNEAKELFLDISCFFLGMDRDFTIRVLEGCNFNPVIDIRVLVDRCLIKFGFNNELVIHDMLRDMGREIVRKESIDEPGRRSRLWYHENALEVLRYGTGTEAVKGLFLNFYEQEDVHVNPKAFENMNRLWLLRLNHVHLSAGYEHIFRRLLWLCWNGFPLKCMPSNLSMEKLVALDLRYSKLKQVWKGTKILDKLKFLYLSHCYHLTKTPDFSRLNSLEELLLNDCISLVEVDKSIRCLNKLIVLDIKNCKKLKKLPSSIWMLKSLEYLDLSGCSKLGKLAGWKGSPSKSRYSFLSSWKSRTKSVNSIGLSLVSVQGSICLTRLNMENCNLSHLPSEIGRLISLRELYLDRNNLHTLPDTISNLTCLKELSMADCNVTHLPSEIGRLVSLENLFLIGNNLCTLPDSINNLTCLKELFISHCNMSHLPNEIGGLISLEYLFLRGNNLPIIPDSVCNLTCLKYLDMADCKVSQLPSEIGKLISLEYLFLRGNNLHTLPESIKDLSCLKYLDMADSNESDLPSEIGRLIPLKYLFPGGNNLHSLPADSISNLTQLDECARLQSLPVGLGDDVYASSSSSLENISIESNWRYGAAMYLYGCHVNVAENNLANNFRKRLLQHKGLFALERPMEMLLPGSEIPNWILYQSTRSYMSFVVPTLENQKILGTIFCVLFMVRAEINTFMKSSFRYDISNKTKGFTLTYSKVVEVINGGDQDHLMRLSYVPECCLDMQLEGGDEIEISINKDDDVDDDERLMVKKWGCTLIYKVDEDIVVKR